MFCPPKEMAASIGEQLTWFNLIVPTPHKEGSDEAIVPIAMVNVAVAELFRKSKQSLTREFCHKFLLAFSEAMTNAAIHGNQSVPQNVIEVGCWIGTQGILVAVRDQGDFYRNSLAKQLVESRESIRSTRNVPSGAGMEIIYAADLIFVSTKENALYFTFRYC